MRTTIKVTVPLKTASGMNNREHHMARSRRVKAERQAVAWMLVTRPAPTGPVLVVMRRVSPSNKGLDSDNLVGALKGVRDQVAEWLGRDDADESVRWECVQRPGKKGEWLVEIEVSAL